VVTDGHDPFTLMNLVIDSRLYHLDMWDYTAVKNFKKSCHHCKAYFIVAQVCNRELDKSIDVDHFDQAEKDLTQWTQEDQSRAVTLQNENVHLQGATINDQLAINNIQRQVDEREGKHKSKYNIPSSRRSMQPSQALLGMKIANSSRGSTITEDTISSPRNSPIML